MLREGVYFVNRQYGAYEASDLLFGLFRPGAKQAGKPSWSFSRLLYEPGAEYKGTKMTVLPGGGQVPDMRHELFRQKVFRSRHGVTTWQVMTAAHSLWDLADYQEMGLYANPCGFFF